jgi:tellurite resistance protein TehA-like permease
MALLLSPWQLHFHEGIWAYIFGMFLAKLNEEVEKACICQAINRVLKI